MRKLVVLLALTLGCAQPRPSPAEFERDLVGLSEDQVAVKLGRPDATGDGVWWYDRRMTNVNSGLRLYFTYGAVTKVVFVRVR